MKPTAPGAYGVAPSSIYQPRAPTPAPAKASGADRRHVEARALAKLITAPNPVSDPAKVLYQPHSVGRREPCLRAHDQLMLRCEWLRALAAGTPPVEALTDEEKLETRTQLEKWHGYAEQRMKRHQHEHTELVRHLEAESRAFADEMARLQACTTLEELESLRLAHEAAFPNVLLQDIPVRAPVRRSFRGRPWLSFLACLAAPCTCPRFLGRLLQLHLALPRKPPTNMRVIAARGAGQSDAPEHARAGAICRLPASTTALHARAQRMKTSCRGAHVSSVRVDSGARGTLSALQDFRGTQDQLLTRVASVWLGLATSQEPLRKESSRAKGG